MHSGAKPRSNKNFRRLLHSLVHSPLQGKLKNAAIHVCRILRPTAITISHHTFYNENLNLLEEDYWAACNLCALLFFQKLENFLPHIFTKRIIFSGKKISLMKLNVLKCKRIGQNWGILEIREYPSNYSNSSSTVIEQDFKTNQIQIRV